MADDALVSPSRIEGAELDDLLQHHWPEMQRTRRNAEESSKVIAGTDSFVLPETFTIAGAGQYVGSIPHPRTVPQRVLQDVIASRPHLSIPLGPKGLGLTPQRLTTKVEEPLNAIMRDRKAGFQWPRACGLLLYEGWAASVTVIDPADWMKRPSAWSDEKAKTWKSEYARDGSGRRPDQDGYGDIDDERSRRAYEVSLDTHRARNVPIRHRAIGIRQCAPIFGPDLSVEGLIVQQEFSSSYLRRKYRFGDAGVASPTGSNGQDGTGGQPNASGRTMTLIEAWLYDDDGIPYYSCCVKGKHAVATSWKGGYDDGKPATINLKDRFGLDRLPVAWEFGLGNPAEINADLIAMGLIEPFAQGWKSVRAKLTSNNVAIMFGSYPILIEEPVNAMAVGGSMEDDEPTVPDVLPMKILQSRPGTKLSQLKIEAVGEAVYRQIELELGAITDESPGKSNKDQSGFSQSIAAAFEEQALTTVHESLGRLYEAHGSFVLEAGKRLPEVGERRGGSKYPSIMVFASTDVPVSDDADRRNEPMELVPDLIDETFTTVAEYDRALSIPEKQQAMEEVARKLKTRRDYLEDTGNSHPETTELELIAEEQRATPEYAKYIMTLVAKIQGAEELEQIERAQSEGLANDAGLPSGFAQGVMPALPPGMLPPPQQGAPGVPVDGSVTGMAAPQYGQSALAGVVGGGTMQGPINDAVAAGGVVPENLPQPGVV